MYDAAEFGLFQNHKSRGRGWDGGPKIWVFFETHAPSLRKAAINSLTVFAVEKVVAFVLADLGFHFIIEALRPRKIAQSCHSHVVIF